jgi:hypothetical protein
MNTKAQNIPFLCTAKKIAEYVLKNFLKEQNNIGGKVSCCLYIRVYKKNSEK